MTRLEMIKARLEFVDSVGVIPSTDYVIDVRFLLSTLAEKEKEIERLQKIIEAQSKGLAQDDKKFAEVESELADIKDAYKATMDEKCTLNETHCTCVPFLRQEITRLSGLLAEVREQLAMFQTSYGKVRKIGEGK